MPTGKKETIEIVKTKNSYTGAVQYVLYIDGDRISTVTPERIKKFLERGISLNDSEGIANYLKYNNL